MIKSFKDKETEKIFNGEISKKLPIDVQKRAYHKLAMLHASKNIEDLQIPPSNRLEKLKGNMVGQYSIRINGQWRICFKWLNGDALEVEIVDYH